MSASGGCLRAGGIYRGGKVALCALACCLFTVEAQAAEVVLTHPDYPVIKSAAIDQPELYAVLTDGGTIITDGGEPVLLECFMDTGASGFVISYLHASGELGVPSLGFGPGDYIGQFTETGVGGQEIGNVSRPFGVEMLNCVPGTGDPINLADRLPGGEHNLWVRREIGATEIALGLVDPLNVVGMPVIRQYVLAMDPTTISMDLFDPCRMTTRLLTGAQASGISTNITFHLELEDLTGQAPPPEVLPATSENPLFMNVSIAHDGAVDATTNVGWLCDTGAAGTLVSFARAQSVGLIDPSYATLDDFLTDHVAAGGLTSQVGGIGGIVTVPLLTLDEIRIGAEQGFDVVWKNVTVHVLDVAELDGVIGLNMFLPAVTLDPLDPLGSLFDVSPGYFDTIIFDATDPDNVELRLFSDLAPDPTLGDLDFDGHVDADDIDLLLAEVLAGTNNTAYDLTGDGLVDGDDADKMIRDILDTEYGDMTLDGQVSAADLSLLAASWLAAEGMGWATGDLTGDGAINAADLSLLAANWLFDRNAAGGAASPSGSEIPEPATLSLLAFGAWLLVKRKRR